MNNKMREEASNLTEQVDILSQEIDMLKPEADRYVNAKHFLALSDLLAFYSTDSLLQTNRAAAVEEELRVIAEKQSFNVSRLVELVKENESIIAQMKVRGSSSGIDFTAFLYCIFPTIILIAIITG